MQQIVVRLPSELTPCERAAWQRLHDGDPGFASPYFSPAFCDAVATVVPSARVAILMAGSEPRGFLPFHRGMLGIGRPIGGHLNDIHGPIVARGVAFDAGELMRASGLGILALRHTCGDGLDGAPRAPRHAFHVIDLAMGFAAYEAMRQPFAKSAFRAIRTRLAKAEAMHGAVTATFDERSPDSIATLYRWKSDQFRATGQPDILALGWVRRLLERLRADDNPSARLQVSTLRFGDRLAAVHVGLRSRRVLHYWLPAYDPAFQELSPGNLLLHRMIEAAAAEGLEAIHLGAGDYRYKHEFANCSIPVSATTLYGPGPIGWAATLCARGLTGLGPRLPSRLARLPKAVLSRLDRHLAFHVL